MTSRRLTAQTLKTAWKVVDTVFAHYQVAEEDRNRMLQAVTLIGLADVAQAGIIGWTSPPPGDSVLVFSAPRSVSLRKDPDSRYRLRKGYSEEKADRAYDEAESLFDRYQLPDDERASLYSALPCLGLAAVQDHLVWKQPPPFL